MKAMVFAAGLGTRLRPLTDTMPKALVPVRGVPMLGRVLTKLRGAGIDSFVVNVHHFAEQIEKYLSPLETGGGIKHAAPLLRSPEGRFLVHNVDILSDLDLRWFLAQDTPENLATLLLIDAPADRCLLFDDDMRLAGWMRTSTGEVKSPYLPDFDPANYRRYSFCGIHIVSEAVFEKMAAWPDQFSIIDFYLSECAAGSIRGVVAPDLQLIDIGSPEKLAEAQKATF